MSDDASALDTQADEALLALEAASDGDEMTSAQQDRSHTIVTTGPDVCWTPRGGGKVAVAYSTIAFMDTSIRLSMSVRNNGDYDFQLNSRTTDIEGHEPGTGKGVVVPGYKKYSHAEIGADYVYSEGFANVSHGDPAWINHDDPWPPEPRRPMTEKVVAQVPNFMQEGS